MSYIATHCYKFHYTLLHIKFHIAYNCTFIQESYNVCKPLLSPTIFSIFAYSKGRTELAFFQIIANDVVWHFLAKHIDLSKVGQSRGQGRNYNFVQLLVWVCNCVQCCVCNIVCNHCTAMLRECVQWGIQWRQWNYLTRSLQPMFVNPGLWQPAHLVLARHHIISFLSRNTCYMLQYGVRAIQLGDEISWYDCADEHHTTTP